MKYIVEYDFRSDNGPRMVGPFDTRRAAQAHADLQGADGWSSIFMVSELTEPGEDR